MNLMDLLKNLAKTYNSLVDKAKVSEAVWQPQEDLTAEDKNFFVQDKTRVISGALDQAAEEIKDIPELVGIGLKVVSDPQGAKDELISFAQNMSWQKAKDFAIEAAKSAVQIDYLTNPKNEYKLYGTGRLGVSIVKLAAGGAALKLAAITKKAPDFFALWNRLRDKMDNLNWAKLERDAFTWDFQKAEDLLKKFDDGTLDPQAWKALKDGGIDVAKRTAPEILETMTRHFKDADFLIKLGGSVEAGKAKYVQIVKEYTGKCSTCGNQGYKNLPDTPDLYLNAIFAYTKKFGGNNIEGFEIPAFNGQPFSQDGFYHMMNHMNANVDPAKVKKVDMTFEDELGESLPCSGQSQNCFDVEMKQPSPPVPPDWVRFYEYKSVESVRPKLSQFTAYLQNINSLSELKYIFNAKKLTTAQAKNGMKAFLKKNSEDIWVIIRDKENIWKNDLGLDSNNDFDGFESLIENKDERLFKFIETK